MKQTYPLASITLAEAMQKQFALVDTITRHFPGADMLKLGDVGVASPHNKPHTTKQVEIVLADYFNSEASIFVRGAGTAAIRMALAAILKSGDAILVHTSAIYPTTKTTIEMAGYQIIRADFNDLASLSQVIIDHPSIRACLIQYTRQSLDDSYDMGEIIQTIKTLRDIPIVCDDNYAVMKVEKIGCELGADVSCFSTFKLLGPEGIGVVVGKQSIVDNINKMQYSGGMQTQGFEALEVLRGLVYAPVALAIQAATVEEVCHRLQQNEVDGVASAMIANAQSKVVLVELEEEIALQVLEEAQKLGAAPHPVGAESKYEIVPMFYRVSSTMAASEPSMVKKVIRINPMRAGADSVIRILQESIWKVKSCS